jgi:hypothetical protein
MEDDYAQEIQTIEAEHDAEIGRLRAQWETHSLETERLRERYEQHSSQLNETSAALQEMQGEHAAELRRVEEQRAAERAELEARIAAAERAQDDADAGLRAEVERLRKLLEEERAGRAEDRAAHARELEALRKEHQDALEVLRREIADERNKTAQADRQRTETEAALTRARQEAEALRAEAGAKETQVSAAQARLAEAVQRATEAEAEAKASAVRATAAEEGQTGLQRELDRLSSRAAEAERRLAEEGAARSAAESEAVTFKRETRERETQLAALQSERELEREHMTRRAETAASSQVAPLQAELARLEAEAETERVRGSEARAEAAALYERLAEAEDRVAKAELKLAGAEMQVLDRASALENAEEKHRRGLKALQHEADEARRDTESVRSQLEHMRQLLTRERDEHAADLSKAQLETAALKERATAERTSSESAAAGQLADVRRRAEEAEATASAAQEQLEEEAQALRARLMEAERQQSEAQLERDLAEQRAAEAQRKAAAERARADDAEAELLERDDVLSTLRSEQVAREVRFAHMDPANLSERDKQEICLRDDEARAANMRRLEARLSLADADRTLRAAQLRDEEEGTPESKAALEVARGARDDAASRLEHAEMEFTVAARRALSRLREEEAAALAAGDMAKLRRGSSRDDLIASQAAMQERLLELQHELQHAGPAAVQAAERNMEKQRSRYESQLGALRRECDDAQAEIARLAARLRELESTQLREQQAQNAGLKRLREEVADWLGTCLEEDDLSETNLMERLKTGTRLCHLANFIDEVEEELRDLEDEHGPSQEVVVDHRDRDITPLVRERELMEVQAMEQAEVGSHEALSNTRAFVKWARGAGISNPDVFEPADLLEDRDHRVVLEGLLEVARHSRGIPLPSSVAAHRALFQPESVRRGRNSCICREITWLCRENETGLSCLCPCSPIFLPPNLLAGLHPGPCGLQARAGR